MKHLILDADTDRSVWWHFLVIHIPDEIDPDLANTGYLLIDGGSNDNPEGTPDMTDSFVMLTGLMADATKSWVNFLWLVIESRLVLLTRNI